MQKRLGLNSRSFSNMKRSLLRQSDTAAAQIVCQKNYSKKKQHREHEKTSRISFSKVLGDEHPPGLTGVDQSPFVADDLLSTKASRVPIFLIAVAVHLVRTGQLSPLRSSRAKGRAPATPMPTNEVGIAHRSYYHPSLGQKRSIPPAL